MFKSAEETTQILEARDSQYAVLTQDNAVKEDKRSRTVDQNGKLVFGATDGNTHKQYYTAITFSYYNYLLLLPTEKKKAEEITSIRFANGELSKIDYLYLVQELSKRIKSSLDDASSADYYDADEAIAEIDASKLLILKDFFKEKDLDDIPSNYDYEYELVDIDQYQEAILKKDPGMRLSGPTKSISTNELSSKQIPAKSYHN